MAVPQFTPEESADLYEQWVKTKTGTCPDCNGVVESRSNASFGGPRARVFECRGRCKKIGSHDPGNAPPRHGEAPIGPGPDKSLGRSRTGH
jgi:hypothetical protein